MGLHPATWLLCWVAFLFLVGRSFFPFLLVVCLVLWSIAIRASVPVLPAVRRIRWVLVSGLIIYAFATAGAPLWPGLGALSPTLNGIATGVEQMLRLVSAVLSLSLLMDRLRPSGVFTALDALLAPLRWLGWNPERLIARLSLTLHYVQPRREASLKTILAQLRTPAAGADGSTVTIERRSFRAFDALVLFIVVVANVLGR